MIGYKNRVVLHLSSLKRISSFRLFLLVMLTICFFSCWNKQSHDIAQPEFPSYTLGVNIQNIDTETPMSNVVFNLGIAQSPYGENYFSSNPVDESGSLILTQVPTGMYEISCLVNNCPVYQDRLYIGFQDTSITVKIPDLLYNNKRYFFHGDGEKWANGIFWKDANTLATLGTWKPSSDVEQKYFRLFEGNLEDGPNVVGTTKFENENPELSGLVWFGTNYLAFAGGFDEPTFCFIDRANGQVAGAFAAPHRLVDLTCGNHFIWATASNYNIYKIHQVSRSVVEMFSTPGNHPGGIAYDSKNIWCFDTGTDWLYLLDDEGKTVKTLALAYASDTSDAMRIEDIEHMTFDHLDNLYIPVGDNFYVYNLSEFGE